MLDFAKPLFFIVSVGLFFLVVVVRYFLVAGLFHTWFYNIKKDKWINRRLSKKTVNKKQFYTEIKWSLITSLIFALAGSFTALMWQNGYTKIYVDVHSYPLWYLP